MNRVTDGLSNSTDWQGSVSDTYVDLDVSIKSDEGAFSGYVNYYPVGSARVSYTRSDPIKYTRNRHQCASDEKRFFIVNAPQISDSFFSQRGKHYVTQAGCFAFGDTSQSYEYGYDNFNESFAFMLDADLLEERLPGVNDVCGKQFTPDMGGAQMFMNYLASLYQHCDVFSDKESANPTVVSLDSQIIDLLVMVIETETSWVESDEPSARSAVLNSVLRYIDNNIKRSDLSLKKIASENGISLRNLHALFTPMNTTAGAWIKERRLQGCYKDLSNPNKKISTYAELAYRWGFLNQASFNRAFKSRYGASPRELRSQAMSDSLS